MIKAFVIALILVGVGMAQPRVAAAQNLDIPGGLDLNGLWELTEHGERQTADPAIVRITHSGNSVYAEFVSGAECYDGGARPDAFLAELTVQPTIPPSGQLSSPAMWVCSGSRDIVDECGGAIAASYKTTFENAVVDPNRIAGERVTQGVYITPRDSQVSDCRLDSSYDGTADFSLLRLTPCAFEDSTVRQLEQELLGIINSTVIPASEAVGGAVAAAQRRFGDTYHGQPITRLEYPYSYLRVATDDDLVVAEAFASALPDLVARPEWKAAYDMAAEMGLLEQPPLIEAQEMIDQMLMVEEMAGGETRRVVEALGAARAAYRNCQQAQP
ncbi:MAG: hypothetical protein WEG36_10500 [Gemmatimonadota bacterium]